MRNLPAGLTATDTNAEFFSTAPINQGGELQGMFRGKTCSFWDLPEHIIQAVTRRFQNDREAQKTFSDDITLKEKIYAYAHCNMGGFDNVPDFDKEGNIKFEYWNCGMRGECPHEFKRCRPDCIIKNHLTKRQVEIVKLVAEGYSYKEIADKIFLAPTTIPSHMKNIKAKLNLNKESEIAGWAYQNNII